MHQENSPAGFVATDTNPVRLYLPVPSESCIHLPTSTELLGSTSLGLEIFCSYFQNLQITLFKKIEHWPSKIRMQIQIKTLKKQL